MSVRQQGGFSIVEVLIAIVILAVGMLALATTSIYATTQVRVADLKTERSLAAQEFIEQLRAGPWTSVTTRPQASAVRTGSYDVWWTVTNLNASLRRVDVITRGPGYRTWRVGGKTRSGWTNAAVDTFRVEIVNAAF